MGRALLSCAFAGCGRQFKSKSALTKHQRTPHLPNSGPSRSLTPNGDQYFCPISGCLRSFKNKRSLTQHSRTQHTSRPAPVAAPSSPVSSEPKSPHELPMALRLSGSRTPDNAPQSPRGGPADDQMDVDIPYHDFDLSPPGSDGLHLNSTHSRSHSPCPDRSSPSPVHVNPASAGASDHVKRTYHPIINGMFIQMYIILSTHELLGMRCDANGNYLDPGTPPPSHGQADCPNDWTPYGSQVEFETAEFLFSHNQMSASDIDILLDLWAASLLKHGDEPPFTSHEDLYDSIDATPLGDVPWEGFSVRYNGARPLSAVPSWISVAAVT
jgi:hypothetical protein